MAASADQGKKAARLLSAGLSTGERPTAIVRQRSPSPPYEIESTALGVEIEAARMLAEGTEV